MANRFVFYALFLAVLAMVVWSISDTINQPSVVDLEGEFVETAFFRNENNTGPVVRIYAIYAADTSLEAMKGYAEFMPHTKYGNTKVFFFNSMENSPKEIRSNQPHFDPAYEPHCLAFYEKNAMGQERFIRFPFE